MQQNANENMQLSSLEAKTLALLCDGVSIEDLQSSLDLSAHTVQIIIENILVKKEVTSFTSLIANSMRE